MKIFWSWQSDTPGKTGRFLIRDALREAISRLKQAPEIAEPVREALHVDQDIQDVAGSPDLAATILAKIDSAEVVVADVTLVGNVVVPADAEKKLINSNVAIELGYALHALTDRNVVLVFNQYYGKHEDLPFDLRHKGGAIVFTLPADATKEHIESERKVLADRFVNALKPYTQKTVTPSAPFLETPSTFSKATYFGDGEVLFVFDGSSPNEITYSYGNTGTLCYLRLLPTTRLTSSIRLPALKNAANLVPLLSRTSGGLIGINRYGAIRIIPDSYPSEGPAFVDASTQLFENGEIWGIGNVRVQTKSPNSPADAPPLLSTVAFEAVCYDTLKAMVGFAVKELALSPPWQVEIGLVGTHGLHLGVVELDGHLYKRGPILKEEIINRTTLSADGIALDELLQDFFAMVHDATGTERRAHYCGFPPNRPGSSPT